jgi:ribosomal protein S17E
MNEKELLKNYKFIFNTQFNPNKDLDMKEVELLRREYIIKDIIEYIQYLSDSFFDLYNAVGDKRYQLSENTDSLAIKKYGLKHLIKLLREKYPENIVKKFEKNMLAFFLQPLQKELLNF